jgi:hypothetical protein
MIEFRQEQKLLRPRLRPFTCGIFDTPQDNPEQCGMQIETGLPV